MNITYINEAIYASSNGVVVEHRRSMIVPILVLVAGVLMLVANYFIDNGEDANNLKSAIVLVGGCVLIVGAIMCGVAIFGGGLPYHNIDKCYLICKQYSFNLSQQQKVENAIGRGDKGELDAIDESEVASILAVCYYSPRGNYVAMQAFVYQDYTYESITELKIVV